MKTENEIREAMALCERAERLPVGETLKAQFQGGMNWLHWVLGEPPPREEG
jgi:hypothetical protein